MRIAGLVSELAVGGAERNAVNYSIAFRRRGHDVTVVAGDGPLVRELEGTGVSFVAAGAHLRRPWELVTPAGTLARLDRAKRYDVAQCFMASAATGARLARTFGARFAIVTAPPGVTEDPREPGWITTLRLRALLASSDIVLSTSDPFRRVMLEAGMRPERIIDVDFNSIPLWRYEASDEKIAAVRRGLGLQPSDQIVCAVARLHPLKRLDLVLRAAPRVLRQVHAARFLFVGDGPERDRLRALSAELGIEEQVRFAGVRSDVGALLRASAVLVQTTYGFGGPGLATLEAFAASRPVVAFDTADRRQAIGESGATVFVEDEDVFGLADAIAGLLSDPERSARMGASGRAWVERRFDLDRVVARLEEIYRRLIVSGRDSAE